MSRKIKHVSSENEILNLKGFLSFLILHELHLASICGDELSKNIGKRRGSPLTPGTIYPTLKKLRKAKLVSFKRAGRKKNYVLTEVGKNEINRLYHLFGNYFYGLGSKLPKKPVLAKNDEKQEKIENKKL